MKSENIDDANESTLSHVVAQARGSREIKKNDTCNCPGTVLCPPPIFLFVIKKFVGLFLNKFPHCCDDEEFLII